jgi:hypothetical protein
MVAQQAVLYQTGNLVHGAVTWELTMMSAVAHFDPISVQNGRIYNKTRHTQAAGNLASTPNLTCHQACPTSYTFDHEHHHQVSVKLLRM